MENKLAAFPKIWEAIAMTFLIVFFLVVFKILVSIFGGSSIPQTAAFLMAYTLAKGLSILIFRKLKKEKPNNPILPSFKKIDIQTALLITIAILALDNGITLILVDFIPIAESTKASLINDFGNLDIFMLIAIIFAAPLFEEYIFRGIMLDGLLQNYSPIVAIVVSSILFGAMHLNALQFFSAMIHGFLLGWVYYKTKNLTYCFLIHFVVNLTGYLSIKKVGVERMLDEGIIEIYGGIGVASIIFVLASVVLFFCIKKLNQIL